MEELVPIEEIEEYCKNTPRGALKDLIEEMKRKEQKKVEKSVFIKARDTLECEKCGKIISTRKDGREICSSCLIEEREEERKCQLRRKWLQLLERLNKIAPGCYKFSEDFEITRVEGRHYCRIEREAIYQRRSFYASGHALRIYTDSYNVKASKLKKDFDTVDPEELHKKCNELFSILEKSDRVKQKQEERETLTRRKIKYYFPESVRIRREVRQKANSRQLEYSGRLVFDVSDLTLSTFDGESFILVASKSLPGELVGGRSETKNDKHSENC